MFSPSPLALTFWLLATIPAISFVGYPLVLRLIAARTSRLRPKNPTGPLPRVSLIISAYNEENSLKARLENALSQSYPAHLLEIIVATDGSADGTDDIVRSFSDRGVILVASNTNRGKTVALGDAIRQATSDILVFTDANSMFHADAIGRLIRWFTLPEVASVCGRLVYTDAPTNSAACEELRYWNWDCKLKVLEGRSGRVLGGNGSIIAMQREYAIELPADVANDLVWLNHARLCGKRVVFEPRALAFEETGGSLGVEYRRRVRIINQGWLAMRNMALSRSAVSASPWEFAIFLTQLVAKKLLRYLSFPALFGMMLLTPFLEPGISLRFGIALWAIVALSLLTSAVRPVAVRAISRWPNPIYPLAMGVASVVALALVLRGRTFATWKTHREVAHAPLGQAVGAGRM